MMKLWNDEITKNTELHIFLKDNWQKRLLYSMVGKIWDEKMNNKDIVPKQVASD